jgi:hypothetical protein
VGVERRVVDELRLVGLDARLGRLKAASLATAVLLRPASDWIELSIASEHADQRDDQHHQHHRHAVLTAQRFEPVRSTLTGPPACDARRVGELPFGDVAVATVT